MNRRGVAICLLAFLVAAASAQGGKAPAAPKVEAGMTLAAARVAVQKTLGTESFGIYLETYSLALPLHEAVALCREYLPKSPPSQRAGLASFSGSLALIAGRYDDAGILFSQAGASRPDLLLKALRCHLAAGDIAEAKRQLDLVPESLDGKSFGTERQIALSWIHVLEGEAEKAFIILKPLAEGHSASAREALFLLWVVASSPDFADIGVSTKGYDARTLEGKLEAEHGGSVELALIRKGVASKPAAWLLAGLFGTSGEQGAERSLARPDPAKDQSPDSGNAPAMLQVGWFSRRENAAALTAKLASMGFLAKTEEQKTKDGEPRWAVIVETGGDWTKTQARLKDLGYESYLLP